MSSQPAQGKREMPIAGVVRLMDLVNHQGGAVVSRTLVTRENRFAFQQVRRCVKRSGVRMPANKPHSLEGP